ncbi:hypothetical protein BDQ17DRAFT_1379571 [Cyathus striatus]|nr:hypothetical protein BDQ17DRAFT_1379571 [Cyathus striatus]
MYKATFFTAVFAILFASALAAPKPQDDPVYHCANEANDECPGPEWTCCGPILQGIGGTCRILEKDEFCAL